MMNDIEIYGFHWRIGRDWGVAHPDDICYNSEETVFVHPETGLVQLGIEHAPKYFHFDTYDPEEPDNKLVKRYDWSVGYISTLESVKYGYLKVMFKLPIGNHLWPAIWMYDCETWPPEVDIVEGWTGRYNWPIFKSKKARKLYRANPFTNRIFPTVHLGTNVKEHWSKSYNKFRGTCSRYLNVTGVNTCEFIWTPDRLLTYYNGHEVMNETDPKILKYFNDSKGMCIHLNNYVSGDFTMEDFVEMDMKSGKGYDKQFRIFDLVYDPDYKKYLIGTKYEYKN